MGWTPLDRESPFQYIQKAISLFNERKGQRIVEIGCIRQNFNHPLDKEPLDCPSRLDGHSTALFAATGKEFVTVDINTEACRLAQKIVKPYPKSVVVQTDGLKFIRIYTKKIDLLYLDAWDVDHKNCAENHYEAYRMARKNLHKDSIILIDDTDVMFKNGALQPDATGVGGKGRLVVPYAIKDGWKVIMNGRCVCLCRNK